MQFYITSKKMEEMVLATEVKTIEDFTFIDNRKYDFLR